MTTSKDRTWITNLIPIVALGVMIIVFSITTNGMFLSGSNVVGLIEQFIPLVMGGLGMIFVIAQGSIDMSFGSTLALCGTVGFIVGAEVGSWLFLPVAIGIGFAIGLFNGVIVSKFKVSSFMVTIAMLITIRAVVQLVLVGKTFIVPTEIRNYNDFTVKIIVTVALIAIVYYLFERTRLGRYSRAIGENEKAVKSSGISNEKYKIIAFIISGVFAGIAGAFMLARAGGTNSNLGNMQELRIFMTMFIGGIPITGGMGTKVYKVLAGAAVIALLENGLSFSGASGPVYEMVEGLILIAVIALTLYMYNKAIHTKTLLPDSHS